LKAGEDFVLRSFLNELRRDAGRNPDARLGPRPDLVFFTGDLANQGRSEEYARAAPLLDELLGILSLGRRQLFLVPGNHDVYRPYTKYLQRDYQNDDSIHEVIRDKRWQRLYRERLGGFDEFVRSYFAEVPERLEVTELGFPAPQVVEVAGNSLLIHLLDPLLGSAGDDDKGKLLLGLIARRAEFVDCPQAALRLALMHHPPDWLCVPDADHFAKHVGEHIDLLLGGHVHKGEFKRTISTRGSMCELRAGALFQGHDYENTAQFAEFDFDTRELLVFPVEYKRDRDRWVRDARFGEHPAYTHREVLPARE
jgi:predicted MPP superfamily phosphohydrolase